MKIGMIAACPFLEDRGTPLRIMGIARALKQKKADVHVITYNLGKDSNIIKIHRIPKTPYKKISAGPSLFKPLVDILLFFKVISTSKKEKFDILIGDHFEGAFIGFFASKILRKRIIFDAHASFADELVSFKSLSKKSILYRIALFIESFIVKRVDHIFADSPSLKTHFISIGAKPENITIIPTGFFIEDYHIDRNKSAKLKKNLSKGKKLILYTGTLAPYQGIDILLDAMKSMGPGIELVIVGGSKEQVDAYKLQAKKSGIEKKVIFTGSINNKDIPLYLSAADILISPRLATEATSMQRATKIIGYMYSGKPIIATKIGAHTCMLNNHNSILITPNDTNEIITAIDMAISGKIDVKKLGSEAKKLATEDYSWDKISEKMISAINLIVNH